MIIPSTLALLVSFGVPASAQSSDASFAASLDQGAPIYTGIRDLLKKPQKPAEPAKPKTLTADDALWQKALETVKRDGKYRPGNILMPGTFSVEDSTGDPKGEFRKEAMSVLGMINEEEQFEAMGAMIIVMEVKRDAATGNLVMEQWMFQTDIYGEVGEIVHGTMTKGPDGKIIGKTNEPANPADPKIKAQYDAMLKHWAERAPKGA